MPFKDRKVDKEKPLLLGANPGKEERIRLAPERVERAPSKGKELMAPSL